MRDFISFYLVLFLVIIIVIFTFIIVIYSTNSIPAALSEEMRLMETSFTIKNVNALLASKTLYMGNYVPMIDLVMASNFGKYSYIRDLAKSTISSVIKEYSSKGINFGYCTQEKCYNCRYIVSFPTKYGILRMCQVELPSITAIGTSCKNK